MQATSVRRPEWARRAVRVPGHVDLEHRPAVQAAGDAGDWLTAGSCAGADPDDFFPPSWPEDRLVRREREARALAVCETCPVVAACLEHALATGVTHGIWGGRTEVQRARLRRERSGDLASRG